MAPSFCSGCGSSICTGDDKCPAKRVPCPDCGERDCGGAPRFAGTTLEQRLQMREAEDSYTHFPKCQLSEMQINDEALTREISAWVRVFDRMTTEEKEAKLRSLFNKRSHFCPTCGYYKAGWFRAIDQKYAERDACAKICERYTPPDWDTPHTTRVGAEECAKLIRARK